LSFEQVEKRHHEAPHGHNHMIPLNPTLYSHYLTHTLNHPIQVLLGKTSLVEGESGENKFDWKNKFVARPMSMLSSEIALLLQQPHPFHIVAAKIHQGDKSKMVAHVIKLAFDATSTEEFSLDLTDIFDFVSYKEMTLTLMHEISEDDEQGLIFDSKCEYCVDLRTFLFSTNVKTHSHDEQIGIEMDKLLQQIEELEKQNQFLQQQLYEEKQKQQKQQQQQKTTQPPHHTHTQPQSTTPIPTTTPTNTDKHQQHSHLQEDWSVFSIAGVSSFFTIVLIVLYVLGLMKDISRTRLGIPKILMAFMFMHLLYFSLSMLHVI